MSEPFSRERWWRAPARCSDAPVSVPCLPTRGVLRFGELSLDAERRRLQRVNIPVRLTRRGSDLLLFLASQPGITFTRAQLLEDVWDFAWDGDTATVTVHVRRIREKIRREAAGERGWVWRSVRALASHLTSSESLRSSSMIRNV